ncbi:hypothetical protein, partial [Tabrizicola oligotrophica]
FLLCAPTFPFALAADKNCAIPTEDEFIEAAVTYFLKVRQPSGGTSYRSDGSTIEQVFLPYRNFEDLHSVNPDCCRVAGLADGDGPLYSRQQILMHDIETTVEIRAALRVITDTGIVLSGERRDRIPMNSCGAVIHPLVGE